MREVEAAGRRLFCVRYTGSTVSKHSSEASCARSVGGLAAQPLPERLHVRTVLAPLQARGPSTWHAPLRLRAPWTQLDKIAVQCTSEKSMLVLVAIHAAD